MTEIYVCVELKRKVPHLLVGPYSIKLPET